MASKRLILVANPGSASRKYGLYQDDSMLARLHFEYVAGKVVCTVLTSAGTSTYPIGVEHIDASIGHVVERLQSVGVLTQTQDIEAIAIRIVAPSAFFLQDRVLDDEAIRQLEDLAKIAPLHTRIVLEEISKLRSQFPGVLIFAISDSKFHLTKPDYAWNYGISLEDADRYDIKRFGFHGLSMAAVVRILRSRGKLATKTVVAHLGSGGSITALHAGTSLDNTMGYSPLEGIIMATRSGTVDYSAVRALQVVTGMNNTETELYLNTKSGLLGLGGSSDIRELLDREASGDNRATLALKTYVYSVQKGIAQMTAALGGIDALVFTGTVGERSPVLRKRIVARLHYLDAYVDETTNAACVQPVDLTTISKLAHSKPIYVVPTDEAGEIARRAHELVS